MTNPRHHRDCPRCKGEGFYLVAIGRGYYRDGSFGHNQYDDCHCYADMDRDRLPPAVVPIDRS